ncbi:MAG: cupredoxin domain-containing protein [Vicinamibacteria bacterium]
MFRRGRLVGRTLLAGLLAAAAAGSAALQAVEEIEVVASNTGFKPGVLRLRRGDPVRLSLRTEDGEHCFAVDALRIEKRVMPGRTTSVDLTPDRAGEFPFYCCLEPDSAKLRGRIVVSE